jgi:hypothetical protein
MPSTTVIFKFIPEKDRTNEAEVRTRRHDFAESLAGPEYRAHQTETHNEAEATFTVTRDWPTTEAAQAWVDFILNDGALFAAVNPD